MFDFLRDNATILILIGALNLVVVYTYVDYIHTNFGGVINSPITYSQDTPSYINAMHFIAGEPTDAGIGMVMQRLLTTPLLLLSSLVVGTFVGNYGFGMLFVNIFFYFFSILIFYNIGFLVFNKTKTAFIATILYITNWCLFSFGTTYLADMGGWFFFLLTTLCGLKYYKNIDEKKWLYFGVFSSILGVFFKEYGALGMSSLVLLTAISGLPLKQKMKEVVTVSLLFCSALFTYHIWFYLHFDFTYFDWYDHNVDSYGAENAQSSNMYTLASFVKVVALIFFSGWPIFLYGMTRMWQSFREKKAEELPVLLALLPASAAFIIWPAFTWRVAFILIPWAALVAAYGLERIRSHTIITITLIAYALFNYHTDAFMWNIDLPF